MPFRIVPQPCWTVSVEGDRYGCGAAWAGAVGLAAQALVEDERAGAVCCGDLLVPVVARVTGGCVAVMCAGCGRPWADAESGLPAHGEDVPAAADGAEEDGWWWDLCPACQSSDELS